MNYKIISRPTPLLSKARKSVSLATLGLSSRGEHEATPLDTSFGSASSRTSRQSEGTSSHALIVSLESQIRRLETVIADHTKKTNTLEHKLSVQKQKENELLRTSELDKTKYENAIQTLKAEISGLEKELLGTIKKNTQDIATLQHTIKTLQERTKSQDATLKKAEECLNTQQTTAYDVIESIGKIIETITMTAVEIKGGGKHVDKAVILRILDNIRSDIQHNVGLLRQASKQVTDTFSGKK